MKKLNKYSIIIAFVLFLALGFILPTGVHAATAPTLGALAPYAIVSSTYTNTVDGTTVNGNVCYTTGPAKTPTINGTAGACPGTALTDQNNALSILNGAGQGCIDLGAAVVLSGTYTPGCYSSSGAGATSMTITTGTTVTLDGSGNPNAVFIFKAAGALKPAANTTILLTNGATANNVFWAPVEATTIGANSTFVGNIIDAAGITIGSTVTLLGRALAFGGTVLTDADTITAPSTLHVIKHVVGGGPTPASGFILTVVNTANPPTFHGNEDGTYVTVDVGFYSVTETSVSDYTQTSNTCTGSIVAGETKRMILKTLLQKILSIT